MIQVTSSKILVEEVKIKKVRAIIVPGQSQDDWDVTYKVLQVGPHIPEGWENVKVGDSPIFNQYVQFASVKVLEKTKAKTVIHVIVDVTDVIAIEEEVEEFPSNLQDVNSIQVFDEETILGEEQHLGDPELFDDTNNSPENDEVSNNSETL